MDVDINKIKEQIEQLDSLPEENRTIEEPDYLLGNQYIPTLTGEDYEVVVNLSVNILKNTGDNSIPESKEMFVNNYHIPVPSGADYKNYSDSFVEYLQESMKESIIKINTNE